MKTQTYILLVMILAMLVAVLSIYFFQSTMNRVLCGQNMISDISIMVLVAVCSYRAVMFLGGFIHGRLTRRKV